ncbi:MAG TPA: GuaB3 family IMP dehydrogenase-related protein [Nitriliruptorales bacterium]
MFEVDLGGGRHARTGYAFDDIAIVPRRRTRDRDLVDLSWSLDAYRLELPLLTAPQDAVTSPATASLIADLGGLGVLNLEGLWTRYEDPADILTQISQLEPGPAATVALQQLYGEPVKEELIGRRVEQLASSGFAAGSLTPQKVERYHHAALEAGLDLLVVHGVVVTAQHVGTQGSDPLDLRAFTARYDIPVVVGGVTSAKSALHLMRTGAVGVLVGVGTGSVSTTHQALGVGVPAATAVAEVASARNRYLSESGRYVQVIASGGIATGGDLAKAIACGADAVMLGRPLAAAEEAPGQGAYWGVSAAHHELPRGRLERLETLGTLEQVLTGPAHRDDGTVNLFGGLRRAMAVCGHEDLHALQRSDLIVRR